MNIRSIFNEVPIVGGGKRSLKMPFSQQKAQKTCADTIFRLLQLKHGLDNSSVSVDAKFREIMKKAGIKFWKPLDVVVAHLSYFYDEHAGNFIGIQEARGNFRIY